MRDGKMAPNVQKAADKLGKAENADVLFFNGEIDRGIDINFIRACTERKRRDNVILVLVTPGGDADVAYRMARCLQSNYKKITIFISGWCKSAGTLLAIGAHKLVMSPYGELGPLDIQIVKQDDLFEAASGLDLDAALKQLEVTAYAMFEKYMLSIEHSSQGRITFRTASEVSYRIVSRLLGNIYAQINPTKMGETTRLMKIAKDYGARLAVHSENFKLDDGIDLLVSSYSSHGFVIDYQEACVIFENVEISNRDYNALQAAMGRHALYPVENASKGDQILLYLNEEIGDAAKALVRSRAAKRVGGDRKRRGMPPGTGKPAADSGAAVAEANVGSDATVVAHPRARSEGA